MRSQAERTGLEGTTMRKSNSLGNAKFLDDLMSSTEPIRLQAASQAKLDPIENRVDAQSNPGADIVLDEVVGEIAEQFRLREILEEVCIATGATGAAIALARGEEMVCRATAGADAPDLGVCLDPNHGLSGSCILTRQLQQCTDTETDPRVDPDACRQLGVRSIAVLPLVRGSELLGVFEILSSRPNAFGQEELDSLQALSGRILPRKPPPERDTAKVPTKSSRPSPKSETVDPRNKTHTPRSASRISHRNHASKRRDLWTPVLGTLVIIVAVLLGAMVGCRIGWERATHQIRNRALAPGATAPSRSGQPDETLRPAVKLQPRSTPVAESEHATGQASQRTGGTTRSPAHPPEPIHQSDSR